MRPKMKELKLWLITHATEIRESRKLMKEKQRDNDYNHYSTIQSDLYYMTKNYRRHHIAYSELRGRTREQIECPREGNSPDEDKIKQIKESYRDESQTLCVSA